MNFSVEGDEKAKDKIEELSRRLKQETLLTFNEIVIVDKLDAGRIVVDKREGRAF